MDLTFNDFFFPVVGLYNNPETGRYDIREIYGTAFYIRNGYYITAGHSAQNAVLCEKYGLGYRINDKYEIILIDDYEVFTEKDIAILKTEHRMPNTKALLWESDLPNMLTEVQTIGFPYGLDAIQRTIKGRAFKGYISAVTKFWRFPNKPAILELSFQCPRGLSGSPIITMKTEKIIGVVIGNEQTEMEIYRETEVISDKKEEIYIKTEFFSFGVGICVGEILEIQSRLLNEKIVDYARRNKLI